MVRTYSITNRILLSAVLLASAAYLLLFLFRPIQDPDLWWHLKSGEYIVENGTLPSDDPFSHTDLDISDGRKKLILTSYWLSQIVLYASYSLLGFKGVIALRFLYMLPLFAVIYVRMKRLAVDWLVTFVIMSMALLSFGTLYFLDRPQIVSFLFASVLLGLLERVREGGKPSLLLMPLMLVWANSHAGFIVGDIVLVLFSVGLVIQERGLRRHHGRILIWAAAGILASLINPNTYHPFVVTFRLAGQEFSSFVIEYRNTYEVLQGGNYGVIFLWALIIMGVFGMVLRKPALPDALIFIFMAYSAFFYSRNVAFFSVVMAPVVAYYVDRGLGIRFKEGTALIATKGLAAAVMVVFLVFFTVKEGRGGSAFQHMVSGFYPSKASEFIETAGVKGKMYNAYDWGGYLIWKLYPDRQVFIDGRGIHESVLKDYISIGKGSNYSELLDSYHVDFVIQPPFQLSGTLQPLMKRLLNDPRWSPVYLDEHAYVFVRNNELNRGMINDYAYDRLKFINVMAGDIETRLGHDPGNITYLVSKAELLIYLGRYQEARQVLQVARSISPSNVHVRKNLEYVEGLVR